MTILVKPTQLEESARIGAHIRHTIRQEPELGLCLLQTQKKIKAALDSFGLQDVHQFVGGEEVTGVVAVIKGNKPGKTIGLRADSDALPLEEKTGAQWSSKVKGKMHACGHDGHVATLLTLCHYAASHRDFAGTLVAVFQPGEEGFAGAKHMIADGLVEKFGIDEFYDFTPNLPWMSEMLLSFRVTPLPMRINLKLLSKEKGGTVLDPK